jgi:hypothetical protein
MVVSMGDVLASGIVLRMRDENSMLFMSGIFEKNENYQYTNNNRQQVISFANIA